MVDFLLNDDQLLIQTKSREFAKQKMAPLVREKEKAERQADRFPWELLRDISRLGLRTLAVPVEYGGSDASVLTKCIVEEELAAVDGGFAMALDTTWRYCSFIARLGTKQQKDEFFPSFMKDDGYLIGSCLSEPQTGTDYVIGYEGSRFSTTARLSNDEWILNGVKCFISTVLEAKLFLVYAATDTSKSFVDGSSAFLVPRDAPGFKLGSIYKKAAMLLNSQGEIILDNCRIPKRNLLGSVNNFYPLFRENSKEFAVAHAVLFLGIARGAYESALDYASQRVQGGKPIIQHQAVGMKLAEMLSRLEAARTFVWRAAWAADSQKPYDHKLGSMSKYFVASEAISICQNAAEICGCNALHESFPLNRPLRDILAAYSTSGTQDAHLINIMNAIIGKQSSIT
jgi:alkylation response protein AidB-like acyl-CoA dehydrogenase